MPALDLGLCESGGSGLAAAGPLNVAGGLRGDSDGACVCSSGLAAAGGLVGLSVGAALVAGGLGGSSAMFASSAGASAGVACLVGRITVNPVAGVSGGSAWVASPGLVRLVGVAGWSWGWSTVCGSLWVGTVGLSSGASAWLWPAPLFLARSLVGVSAGGAAALLALGLHPDVTLSTGSAGASVVAPAVLLAVRGVAASSAGLGQAAAKLAGWPVVLAGVSLGAAAPGAWLGARRVLHGLSGRDGWQSPQLAAEAAGVCAAAAEGLSISGVPSVALSA